MQMNDRYELVRTELNVDYIILATTP